MSRIIEKGWRHFALWGSVVVYMLIAPGMYDEFLATEGMPLPEAGNAAPVNDPRVHANINHLIGRNDQGLYELQGWAFVDNAEKRPAGEYTRQVVLFHSAGRFAYETETTRSFDIDVSHKALGMDLTRAGFSALIYADGLTPGVYSLGIFLYHSSGGESSYSFLNACVWKTPNRLILASVNDPGCFPMEGGFGQPVAVDVDLPGKTAQSNMWVETLTSTHTGRFFRMQGWAFLTVDKTVAAGGYDRQLVLIGAQGNFVYAADVMARPDVDDHFQSEGMDLLMSGFSVVIDPGGLPEGIYGIGLMFFEKETGAAYFVDAGRCLQWKESEMVLAPNGSADCSQPYLTGGSFPAAPMESDTV